MKYLSKHNHQLIKDLRNGLNSSVVEHWTENPRAVGSIPALSISNIKFDYLITIFFFKCFYNSLKQPAWRNGRRARLKI